MLKSFHFFETQDEWDNEVAQTAAKLKANTGYSDLGEYAAKVIHERLEKYPFAYLEFGVYWWAVKQALINAGYAYSDDEMDDEMRDEYMGKTAAHTFVAAEKFSEYYRGHFFQFTHSFTLTDDGDREWYLFDTEMEQKIK